MFITLTQVTARMINNCKSVFWPKTSTFYRETQIKFLIVKCISFLRKTGLRMFTTLTPGDTVRIINNRTPVFCKKLARFIVTFLISYRGRMK